MTEEDSYFFCISVPLTKFGKDETRKEETLLLDTCQADNAAQNMVFELMEMTMSEEEAERQISPVPTSFLNWLRSVVNACAGRKFGLLQKTPGY